MFDGTQLCFEHLDLLGAQLVGLAHRRRVDPLTRGARALVAGRVLLTLQPFDLGNDPPPRRFERRELFQGSVGIEAAISQSFADEFRMFTHKNRVEHAPVIVRYDAAWPSFGKPFGKPSSPPQVSARGSFPPPRRSRKKCCRSWTSRSFNTASKKRSPPVSTTSSSSPAAARMPSRITSTSRSNSRRFLKRVESANSSPRSAKSRT